MNTVQNKQLLQQIFAELAQGNARPFVAAMAEDFRWTVAGTGTWARTFDGKQAVINELFGALRERIEGNVKTIPQRFIADGDVVVVEARGNNVTKSGVPYNNTYCFVFRLADGQLQEVTEYMDTELCTAVLGELG